MVRIGFYSMFLIQVIFFTSSGCVNKTEVEKNKREFVLPVQIGKIIYKDVTDQVRAVGNIRSETASDYQRRSRRTDCSS